MAKGSRLIDYLPFYDSRTEEFKEVCKAEQPFIDRGWSKNNELLGECFVESAESYGLGRMEKALFLESEGISIPDRRANIIFKLMGDTPYTMVTLHKRLKTLCRGNYILRYGPDPYTVFIRVGVGSAEQFEVIKKLILRIMPANIGIDIDIKFNTHKELKDFRFTHRYLSEFTHFRVRITNFYGI